MIDFHPHDENAPGRGKAVEELRDKYAMAALQGEMASQEREWDWPEFAYQRLAERCFKIADAMLAAREVK